jgi:hypothetical protein
MFKVFLTYLGGGAAACAVWVLGCHINVRERRRSYVDMNIQTYFGGHLRRSSGWMPYYKRKRECDEDPKCMALFNCINEHAKTYGCDKVDLDHEKKALAYLLLNYQGIDCESIKQFKCMCRSKKNYEYLRMSNEDRHGGVEWVMEAYRLDGYESFANYITFACTNLGND